MPEKSTTPSDQAQGAAGFLKRWSERKADAAAGRAPAAATPPEAAVVAEPVEAPVGEGDAANDETTPPPVTEADLENLTYESDYTKFLGDQVPDALRQRALRQLWRSDPILANLDGLCDYDDDFTDAALAVNVLQTAHKVGQGYLTDDEVAANQARGTPSSATEPAQEADERTADGEDIDDADDGADAPTVAADDTPDVTSPAAGADTDKAGGDRETG